MGRKLVLNEVTRKQRDLFTSLKVDVSITESVHSFVIIL